MPVTWSSTSSGFSQITIQFEIGRDPDLAAIDVQNRVNQVLGRMPTDVRTNGITVSKETAGFLGAIGFFSPDNRYDSLFISNYIDVYIRDALKRILVEPKNALLKQFAKLFELDDVELHFTDDAIEAIADLALQRGTGARGLRAILEELLLDVMFDVPSEDDIAQVIITREAVTGEGEPELISRSKVARRRDLSA